jgi:methylthioribose-1-phosphate isomerase
MRSAIECVQAVEWIGQSGGHLRLIDQTRLPASLTYIDCHDAQQVWDAIKQMRVRGAPAIAIAASYGVCLAD